MNQTILRFLTWCMAMVAVLGLCSMAAAQPATQPGGPQRPFAGDGPGGRRMFTPEQAREIDNWSRQHLPNLYQLQLNSEFPRRRALRQFASMRMRAIQQAKDDPRLEEKLTNGLKEEDEIFGCLLELDRAPADQRDVALQNLRNAVRKVVEAMLSERAERLERIKARIRAEEEQLAADQARFDEMVERRMRQFLPPWAQEQLPQPPAEGDSTTTPAQ